MDTLINWYHVRGLGALATIGLFLLYAVFAGWWQGRKVDRRANRAVEQNRPSSMARSMPSDLDRRAA